MRELKTTKGRESVHEQRVNQAYVDKKAERDH